MIDEDNNKYFLLAQKSKDETKLTDKFDICKYDSIHNNFDRLENPDEYCYINSLFDKRVQQKKLELSLIHKIDFDNLIKLEVSIVRKYDYKFKYEGKIIHKNIEFYSNTKPQAGDYVYVSMATLGEDMLAYGHIKNIEEVNHQNILIIERKDKRIYLRRYYG